jgi:hypothetical protein
MRISLSSILFVVMLGIACSQRPNDDKIAKDIQNKIASDPDTKDSQINVAAKDGKVTLSGQATTPAAQQKVEQFSHQEPGATGLDDETTIAAAPAAAAAATPTAPPQAMAAPTPPAPHKETMAAAPPVEATPVPKPQPIVIPAGTVITIRTSQALSSKTSQTGQSFVGSLDSPVSVEGKTAIPKGADVSGTVVAAKEQGKIKGEGELDLALTSIMAGGRSHPVKTEVVSNTSKSKGKRTAVTTGGGAAGGALIGGIAGGGKGAAIGALAGGGAGLVGGAMTGNKPIEIPAESVLTFTLTEPLTLPPPNEAEGHGHVQGGNEQAHP